MPFFVTCESFLMIVLLSILTPDKFMKLCMEIFFSNQICIIGKVALKLENFKPIFLSWSFWPCVSSVETVRNLWHTRYNNVKRNSAVSLEIRCQFHQRFTCSFYACRSKKCQITLLTWLSFFAHSGSTCVKAVRRTLMKLSPEV